jgi:hypothetical protein
MATSLNARCGIVTQMTNKNFHFADEAIQLIDNPGRLNAISRGLDWAGLTGLKD